MSRVDLHIHSNASDGRLSPEEVVEESVMRGLSVIALTDHDTITGLVPALALRLSMDTMAQIAQTANTRTVLRSSQSMLVS